MPAKVIRGSVGDASAPVRWPGTDASFAAHGHPPPPPTEEPPPNESAELLAQIASLRSELESAKTDAGRRVAEALASGRREGDSVARQALEKVVEAEASKLRHMLQDVLNATPKLRRQAEEELVRLAVAVARRIIHRELTVDVDALVGLVKSAFDRLDAREIQQIRTDPGAVDMLKQVVESLGTSRALKVVGDPSLRSGSLLIETTRGELDASVETQLQEIQRGFIDIVHHS